MAKALSDQERALIDAYWRAANYLSVGQIYLYDNPLLEEPLPKEHIKPRLLGPLGHDAGPELHLCPPEPGHQEARPRHDLHHRPGPRRAGAGRERLPRGHLQRGLSEHLADEAGMKRLFKQFSFPGGIPSHVAPETPGSIHEGGELGYSLSHAYGAAFDNPDLIVACVVGDGEAETGPLATSWHSNKFLNPVDRRRGPADPAPQRLQDRQPDRPRPHQPRGAGSALPRLRLHALLRRGRRAGDNAPADGGDAGQGHRRDPAHPDGRASERLHRTAPLADDRAAHAQGLDLPQGDRRQAHRGLSGARTRCRWARCTRTRATCSILEAAG